MTEFKSWRDFWKFERELMRDRRFVRSPEAEEFLTAVQETCPSRRLEIPSGRHFWRAQLGHDWRHDEQVNDDVPCPLPRKRMVPLRDRAFEGRVNSKGIPCLYLATTQQAATCEVRPWIGSPVSVAQFETVHDLALVDCSKFHAKGPVIYLEEPPPLERERAAWINIDKAFATPVTRTDDTGEYIATQVLAELFRSLGYDGVAYKSAFGDTAYNLAIFDLDAARQLSCHLFEARTAAFTFEETANPYWVTTAKPERKRRGGRSRH